MWWELAGVLRSLWVERPVTSVARCCGCWNDGVSHFRSDSSGLGRLGRSLDPLPWRGISVRDLATFDFSGTDLLFHRTGATNSREISPKAAASGCIVIDNSSAFRMDPAVPLVVPEVNLQHLDRWQERRILPVANCSTIQLVVALKPLHDAARIKRIVVATYQSASGGRKMIDSLLNSFCDATSNIAAWHAQAKGSAGRAGKAILFNVVPHIDVFLADGRTREEWKMEVETRKILMNRLFP